MFVKTILLGSAEFTRSIAMYTVLELWEGECAGGRSSSTIFFFAYLIYIFSPERGNATFILIDVQNNFYVYFNLRQLENEFYYL
jgi:hypothetical protein